MLVNANQLHSKLSMKTDQLPSDISFTSNEILKILQNQDIKKVHGHDMITI